MRHTIVLSDEMLKEFYSFKHNGKYSNQKIEKLLHFYKPPHLTNVEQLQRIDINDDALFQSLAQNDLTTQSVEILSKMTLHKLIIGDTSSEFPHVNIESDVIESNYTSTYTKNVERIKAREHIKALLENANNVFIYDSYFKANWGNTKRLFSELMPRKSINIFYRDNQFDQNMKNEMRRIYLGWSVREDRSNPAFTYMHDRYLVIDNKVEIILTSGFDYLFDDSKDFSYIVRIRS